MKTDGIIAALEKLIPVNSDEHTSQEQESTNGIQENTSVLDHASKPSIDILSVRPPWEASNIDLDSPSIDERTPSQLPRKKNERRTRSSSRNRTPKSIESARKAHAGKTFSVERKTTKARTIQSTRNEKPKMQKRKRDSGTFDNSVVQKKKSKKVENCRNEADDKIDENLRNEIMQEIRQKIAKDDKLDPKKSTTDDRFSSRIPRFSATGVTVGSSKPMTPGNKDWKKHHARKFKKLESIDDYEERKKERAKRLLGSRQKNNAAISRLAQPSRRGGAKIVKPVKPHPVPTFTSPAPRGKLKTPQSIMKTPKEQNRNTTKTPRRESSFKPTVMSTSKMNLNFGKKASKMQTPKRVTIVSDQNMAKQKFVKTPGTGIRNKSVLGTPGEKRKSYAATPKAAGDSTTMTPGGSKKPTFDLKQSLKKPLSWVPHSGPLKPYNDMRKKPSFQDRIENLKNPKVQSRESRRQKIADKKRQAKDNKMMQRRGIK